MRRRKNPSTGGIVVIGVGVALLGVGAYFLFRKPAGATVNQTTSSAPNQLPPASKLGSGTDPNSVAYACNTAWKLTALGHSTQAAPWASKCQAGGGTIPQAASQQYA